MAIVRGKFSDLLSPRLKEIFEKGPPTPYPTEYVACKSCGAEYSVTVALPGASHAQTIIGKEVWRYCHFCGATWPLSEA